MNRFARLALPGLLLAAWVAWLLGTGPGGSTPVASATSPAPVAPVAETIAWFDGSVDAAFARAAAEHKPVLLYWGAAWCPPCNQLKATVFRRPDFVAKTRFFVAVYIDGDSDGAQAYQDRFATLGYPTLVVFDPGGLELTRIPGGMDLERYPEVLEFALRQVAPAAEILARYLDQSVEPQPLEWRLLAHYSWRQDAGRALGGRDAQAVLSALVAGAPAGMPAERARFEAEYLRLLTAPGAVADPAARRDAVARIDALFDSEQATAALASFLSYELAPVIAAVAAAGSAERERLLASWRQWIESQGSPASDAEALGLLHAQLGALTLAGAEADAALRRRIDDTVQRALAAAHDAHERSAVLSGAVALLELAGQPDEAMSLLRAALDDGEFGYYWMADLARIAEAQGRDDEALDWLRRAWNGARGAATRLQWAGYYLDGLTRLSPAANTEIGATLQALFDELEAQDAPLHGRNRSALQRIGLALTRWADTPERRQIADAARSRLRSLCGRDPGADAPALQGCERLLDAPPP